MTAKLTPWFPPDVKPVRVGVYEARWTLPAMRVRNIQYQHWNGVTWGAWAQSPTAALRNAIGPSMRQDPEWRGLAKEPKQ